LTGADKEQNVIGMSVVGSDFEKLKRFNLEELRPKLVPKEAEPQNEVESKNVKQILKDDE
jgi:hypothetical protein